MIEIKDFTKVEMRVGTIISASLNELAKKPAYKLTIDFGEYGIKNSSAQITDVYNPSDLINKQVVAVMNFKPMKIGDIYSEVLVLGVDTPNGVVLLKPDSNVENGTKVY